MTKTGRVIDNPLTGERIVILQTGTETGGSLLSFELFLPPGGHVPASHVHPEQEERFTVLEGQVRFRVGRRAVVVGAGETIAIEAGHAHWFGNPGPEMAHAHVEVRPALRMEEMFVATSNTGRVPGTKLPSPSDLAAILLEFRREVAMPHMPAFLVSAFLGPLAWLSRRRHR